MLVYLLASGESYDPFLCHDFGFISTYFLVPGLSKDDVINAVNRAMLVNISSIEF